MRVSKIVAQRAAQRPVRRLAGPLIALMLAVSAVAVIAPLAIAAGPKVVIVVGPVGSKTASYIDRAKAIAAQARSYGASVTEIYSPNATWTRVKSAAQGAKLFVYLGHGNGSPSPYGSLNRDKMDGLGLNPTAGGGNTTTKYYGESYLARYIRFAPNAVVILNHLCYASGNSEPQNTQPGRAVARQRVDNYGAGFLAAGAKAVFAYGWSDASSILAGLFRSDKTMLEIFWSDPSASGAFDSKFLSERRPGAVGYLDPYSLSQWYRSIVGYPSLKASTWR